MSPAFARRAVSLATVLLALLAPAAVAVPGPLLSGYVTDAPVTAVATDNQGRAYIGGGFDHVGPRFGHGISLTTASSTPTPASRTSTGTSTPRSPTAPAAGSSVAPSTPSAA